MEQFPNRKVPYRITNPHHHLSIVEQMLNLFIPEMHEKKVFVAIFTPCFGKRWAKKQWRQ
jgi:hypothetical protein